MSIKPSRASLRGGLLAVTVLLTAALAGVAGAETRVGGEITGTETWDKSGNPYIATGDISIRKGGKLVIGPGVEIGFKRDIQDSEGANAFDLELLVEGTLVVNGAEDDTVVFVSSATNPRWTDWQGIVVRGPDARAEISVARIQFANEGLKVMGGEVIAENLTIKYCNKYGMYFIRGRGEFTDCLITDIANPAGSAYGINLDEGSQVSIKKSFVVGAQNGIVYARRSGGLLEESVVTLCSGPGVLIHNSNPTVTRCTLTGNGYGMLCSAGSVPVVHQNNIFENGTANLWVKDYQGERVDLDFTNNWWGVSDLALVEDMVDDAVDDPTENGYVKLDPFLSEPTTNQLEMRSAP